MTFTQTILLASSTASLYRSSFSHCLTQAKSAFYDPTHFPKFLGGFMISSGIAGYQTMAYVHNQRIEVNRIIEGAILQSFTHMYPYSAIFPAFYRGQIKCT